MLLHQLDITDSGSIARFAEWAEQELHMVDVLVNNAGFAFKGNAFGAEEAQQTIGVNFRGTANVTEALLPLIPDGGRIINVGSSEWGAGGRAGWQAPPLLPDNVSGCSHPA